MSYSRTQDGGGGGETLDLKKKEGGGGGTICEAKTKMLVSSGG